MALLIQSKLCSGARFICEMRRSSFGSAVLEVSIVLPVFFLLLFGLMYFSIALFGYCNATYSSRAAVRYASLHSSTSLSPCTAASVQSVVTPYLAATPLAASTITTTWSPSNTVGGTVTVSTTLVFSVGIPFSGLNAITVGSSARRPIIR
jgi:Flp pilus assembly protein TadG